jgi:hypothetical protein
MRSILAFVLILLTGAIAFGQSVTPAQRLRLARSIYEQGRLSELPDQLGQVIREGSTEEKVEAYKLLTLTYIYMEEPAKADEAMLALLKTDPEFKTNEAIDPAEFIALFNTFRTEPIFRVGLKGGMNASQPNVRSFFPTTDGTSAYRYRLGFQGGFSGEMPLSARLTLAADLQFHIRSFGIAADHDTRFSLGEAAREVQRSAFMPMGVQYDLLNTKKPDQTPWRPYLLGGGYLDYFVSASNTIETEVTDKSGVPERVYAMPNYFRLNYGLQVGGGIKRKIKTSVFSAEIRFLYGLRAITNDEQVFDVQAMVFDNHFVHGKFAMNSLQVSLSYMFNTYKPKKISK